MTKRGDQAAEQAAVTELIAAAISRLLARAEHDRTAHPGTPEALDLSVKFDEADERLDRAVIALLRIYTASEIATAAAAASAPASAID